MGIEYEMLRNTTELDKMAFSALEDPRSTAQSVSWCEKGERDVQINPKAMTREVVRYTALFGTPERSILAKNGENGSPGSHSVSLYR